jgi:hypothetical protein
MSTYKLKDFAVLAVRSIAKHVNAVGQSFLADPIPFIASPHLTPAQRCAAFNLAMSLAGIGLKMPSVQAGARRVNQWDDGVFQRGVALAKGRAPVVNHWVHQSYQPVSGLLEKARRRSFYTLMTQAALTGLIEKVDPAQFKAADAKGQAEALKAWYIKVMGDGKTEGTLTGTKAKPGVLATSRNFSVAVRADLAPRDASTGRATITAESLVAELTGETAAPSVDDELTEMV